MPTAYCRQNPFSTECLRNPNYVPPSYFPSSGGSESPVYQSNTTKVISNTGGVGVYQNVTTLDKVLATILSGLALTTRQPYVPTTEQPRQNETVYRETYNPNIIATNQNNIGGQVTEWIKQNSTLAIIVVIVGGAYLAKSPRQKR